MRLGRAGGPGFWRTRGVDWITGRLSHVHFSSSRWDLGGSPASSPFFTVEAGASLGKHFVFFFFNFFIKKGL